MGGEQAATDELDTRAPVRFTERRFLSVDRLPSGVVDNASAATS
jgi:hypothetical protein